MSEKILYEIIDEIQHNKYSWDLYFVRINKKEDNPYCAYKYTFKKADYITNYIQVLCKSVKEHQLSKIESIQNYNGENCKTSCDKLNLDDNMIRNQWENLYNSVCNSERVKNDKYKNQGYILCGNPKENELQTIVMGKVCNPVVSAKDKFYLKKNENDELDDITDDIFRLFRVIDFIVVGNTMYTFNHNFERFFMLEAPLKKLKNECIERIIETDAFLDINKAEEFIRKYNATKLYLGFNNYRLKKLKNIEGRKEIAELLNLEIKDDKIVIKEKNDMINIAKYICFKIFVDKETNFTLETNTVERIDESIKKK